MSCNDEIWPTNLKKWTKLTTFDPHSSPNIGHGDLLFGIIIKTFHIINNYHVRTKCVLNWRNVQTKSSKSTKITLFLPYISLNIGHSDPIFSVQIKLTQITHNYHVRTSYILQWQNLTSKSWKIAKFAIFWPLYLPKYRSRWPNFWYTNKDIPHH